MASPLALLKKPPSLGLDRPLVLPYTARPRRAKGPADLLTTIIRAGVRAGLADAEREATAPALSLSEELDLLDAEILA